MPGAQTVLVTLNAVEAATSRRKSRPGTSSMPSYITLAPSRSGRSTCIADVWATRSRVIVRLA